MDNADLWTADWVWSLPLIMATVIFHVFGLGLLHVKVPELIAWAPGFRHDLPKFAVVMGVATLVATVLHGLEALAWAIAYRQLDALPTLRDAMLYSLSAMTTYGHASDVLADRWRLLGALEALNGVMLVGLTTAFLFSIIANLWQAETRHL